MGPKPRLGGLRPRCHCDALHIAFAEGALAGFHCGKPMFFRFNFVDKNRRSERAFQINRNLNPILCHFRISLPAGPSRPDNDNLATLAEGVNGKIATWADYFWGGWVAPARTTK